MAIMLILAECVELMLYVIVFNYTFIDNNNLCINYKSINVSTADDNILVIAYSKSDWAARFLQQRMNMLAVLYQTLRLHREGVASQTTPHHCCHLAVTSEWS